MTVAPLLRGPWHAGARRQTAAGAAAAATTRFSRPEDTQSTADGGDAGAKRVWQIEGGSAGDSNGGGEEQGTAMISL